MDSLSEVAMQTAMQEVLSMKEGDSDYWTAIEYGGVMFDLNIWRENDTDDFFKVTLYPVVEKHGYFEAETSVFFQIGELFIPREA